MFFEPSTIQTLLKVSVAKYHASARQWWESDQAVAKSARIMVRRPLVFLLSSREKKTA